VLVTGPDNRGAEIETPKASREGMGSEPRPKTSFGVFRAGKTHLIGTNLSYLTFLRHIFSHIHIHNY